MLDDINFSVVVPLFNKGPFIVRTLNSIFNQTFQNFEVVIVDDGSVDNGVEIINDYHNIRIRLIRQENQGVSAARNRGIFESKNNYIALLDADDEWAPTHLETLAVLIQKYPQCALFSTSTSTIKNDKKYISKITQIPEPPWDGVINNFFSIATNFNSVWITSSSVAFRKETILSVSGFPHGVKQYEDEVVWGKIALRNCIAFSWDGEAIYYSEKGGASSQLIPIYEHPFVGYAEKMIIDGNVPPQIKDDLRKYIFSLNIRIACRNIRCGNFQFALKNLKSGGLYVFKPMNSFLIISSFILFIKKYIILNE